jgi:hypothetical protein
LNHASLQQASGFFLSLLGRFADGQDGIVKAIESRARFAVARSIWSPTLLARLKAQWVSGAADRDFSSHGIL